MAMIEAERKAESDRREREKERALLYGALPESVATRMLRGESVAGDHYDGVSVIFLDIVKFTELADKIPAGQVVFVLEQIFSALDDVCAEHGATKIKTVGDSYMAVVGAPEPLVDHVQRAALCALQMKRTIDALEISIPSELGDTAWLREHGAIEVRIGIHSGPATAGVIGKQRLQYDVWGDTVNVASRMESTGEPGKIHVSEAFASFLAIPLATLGASTRNDSTPHGTNGEGTVIPRTKSEETKSEAPGTWHLALRGETDVKGKGRMTTYWLEDA